MTYAGRSRGPPPLGGTKVLGFGLRRSGGARLVLGNRLVHPRLCGSAARQYPGADGAGGDAKARRCPPPRRAAPRLNLHSPRRPWPKRKRRRLLRPLRQPSRLAPPAIAAAPPAPRSLPRRRDRGPLVRGQPVRHHSGRRIGAAGAAPPLAPVEAQPADLRSGRARDRHAGRRARSRKSPKAPCPPSRGRRPCRGEADGHGVRAAHRSDAAAAAPASRRPGAAERVDRRAVHRRALRRAVATDRARRSRGCIRRSRTARCAASRSCPGQR